MPSLGLLLGLVEIGAAAYVGYRLTRKKTGAAGGKEPASGPPRSALVPIDQKVITDAVWDNLHGNPVPLSNIVVNFDSYNAALRTYIVAASIAGTRYYADIEQFVKQFNAEEAARQKGYTKQENDRIAIQNTVVGAAAAAANAIPVAGQIISLGLVLGQAIGEAIRKAYPLPVRKAEDQIYNAREGRQAFFGFVIDSSTPDLGEQRAQAYRDLQSAVSLDQSTLDLPVIAVGTEYKIAPTYQDWQAAQAKLLSTKG